MRAQLVVDAVLVALVEEVEILVPHGGQEAIGVAGTAAGGRPPTRPSARRHQQDIQVPRNEHLEQPLGRDESFIPGRRPLGMSPVRTTSRTTRRRAGRARTTRPAAAAVGARVHSQDEEWERSVAWACRRAARSVFGRITAWWRCGGTGWLQSPWRATLNGARASPCSSGRR